MDVRGSYDSAAAAYAEHLLTELEQKPLDRHLLNRFAEGVAGGGVVADLGCGPGHVGRYLHDRGLTIVGIDRSPEMIRIAERHHPGVRFAVGDMLALDLADGSLAGLVAFYAVVHFDGAALARAAREFQRVLAPGGLALVSFHVGDETVHVDDLFGVPVDLDFRFHPVAAVARALAGAGLTVIEQTERLPYAGSEYPSRRGYLLARRD